MCRIVHAVDHEEEAADMKFKTPLALAIASVLALAACEPGPAGTNTQSGAVTGAVLGGIFGATRKGDDKLAKAATGALVGGAIGGLVGNQLDKQAAELERDIQNDRVRIVNTGSQLVVTMPEGILFATDSDAVQPSIQNDLFALADNLNRYPNTRVEVVGHTDASGSAAYNQDLSQRRAASVAAILRSAGVSGGRLVSYGRGEDQPVASNLTPEGRAQNRRVEIFIIPVN
jgi:outer membrane protein OmpA-like peptidoglycan-associated protein